MFSSRKSTNYSMLSTTGKVETTDLGIIDLVRRKKHLSKIRNSKCDKYLILI